MGLSSSKLNKHETSDFIQEGSIPSTPILTPKIIKTLDLDPRSPSTFISRTPIEILSAAAKKLENGKETTLDTPICNKHILLRDDPRSPSIEFKRTPILINANESEPPKTIYNKNLEKVIRSELTTPKLKKEKAVSKGIPPKLLDSSPIHPKPDAYKRKSFVGLLETNIDFTETDIDKVFQEKCKGGAEFSTSLNKIDIVQNQNVDPRSPTTDFLRTPLQIIKKIGEIDLNDDDNSDSGKMELENHEELENKENCPNIESTKLQESPIQHTLSYQEHAVRLTISDPEILTTVIDIQNESTDESELCITQLQPSTVSDNAILINQRETHDAAEETINSEIVPISCVQPLTEEVAVQECQKSKSPPSHVKSDNRDMGRQVVHPIYEDDDIVVCPRVVKIKDYEERSPLKIRNGIETDRKKSGQKLKVSDKPRNIDSLCKIPVYKQKIRKSGMQCENTPPRNMEMKNKVKPCLWDNSDKTLYL